MTLLSLIPQAFKEKLRRRAGAVTTRARLENLSARGFQPRRIIDAGAFRGEWAALAHEIFPEAALLLIEPQPSCAMALREWCSAHAGSAFSPVLLGASPGSKRFLLQQSNSRAVPNDYVPAAGETILDVEQATLAAVAAAAGFAACDFLKLDLQGHELEALAGAGAIFGDAEVILTEVSWLRIGEVPLAVEVIERFREQGYRLYDVFGFNYRPLDQALWQTDFIFVRESSSLIADRRWAA